MLKHNILSIRLDNELSSCIECKWLTWANHNRGQTILSNCKIDTPKYYYLKYPVDSQYSYLKDPFQ